MIKKPEDREVLVTLTFHDIKSFYYVTDALKNAERVTSLFKLCKEPGAKVTFEFVTINKYRNQVAQELAKAIAPHIEIKFEGLEQ